MPRTNALKFDRDEAESINQRLARSSKLNGDTGCIEWVGALMHQGYGHVNWRGKVLRTHRASYAANNGEIPKGAYICHKCDNPKCINQDHLFLGSQAENSADMVKKKRSTIGEKNPQSKLTVAQVQAIRILATTGMIHRNIAEKFHVTRGAIGLIVRGERWKYV